MRRQVWARRVTTLSRAIYRTFPNLMSRRGYPRGSCRARCAVPSQAAAAGGLLYQCRICHDRCFPCMVSNTLARGLFAVFVSASSRKVKNNSYDRDHCHRWSNGGHGYLPLGPVVAKRGSRFAGHSQTQSHPQARYPHTTLNRESLTAEIAKMPNGRAVAVAKRPVLRDRLEVAAGVKNYPPSEYYLNRLNKAQALHPTFVQFTEIFR